MSWRGPRTVTAGTSPRAWRLATIGTRSMRGSGMRWKLVLASVPATFVLATGLVANAQQGRPAPTEDRVGYPEGYQESYTPFYTFDRPDNRQVRVVYGNDQAAAAEPGRDFTYGSILVMETYR